MRPKIEYHAMSVHVEDSWCINSKVGMELWLEEMRNCKSMTAIVGERSNGSLRREWEAHNFLFFHGYKRDQTAHVDFNDEPWYRRAGYFVLAVLFVIFERRNHDTLLEEWPRDF